MAVDTQYPENGEVYIELFFYYELPSSPPTCSDCEPLQVRIWLFIPLGLGRTPKLAHGGEVEAWSRSGRRPALSKARE